MACAAFGGVTLLLFGFIYWQTAWLETNRIDQFISHEYIALSRETAAEIVPDVRSRYSADLHRQGFASVFTAQGAPVAGGLAALPSSLPADGQVHEIEALRRGEAGPEQEKVRAVAGRLPDGRLLVVGRSQQDLAKLRLLILRALGLGFVPMLAAALGIGLLASQRTILRVRDINRAIGRIMQGHLDERLPSAGSADALAELAASCNRMLSEIERLVDEVKGVGDNIAHDLRTPLTRLRWRMESARARAGSQAELDGVLARSIEDLDQCLGMITAILRIGELEAGRRQAGFARVSLARIVVEAAELYAPMAEQRGLQFQVTATPDADILGDRELLLEAVVNLLDNAVKFAPQDGAVAVAVLSSAEGWLIRVADTGQGIPAQERDAVLERFYRAASSRHIAGSGLGLSLVSAVLRLHGFDLRMSNDAFGFAVDILIPSLAGKDPACTKPGDPGLAPVAPVTAPSLLMIGF
jgi:signal transduction histidine kinase